MKGKGVGYLIILNLVVPWFCFVSTLWVVLLFKIVETWVRLLVFVLSFVVLGTRRGALCSSPLLLFLNSLGCPVQFFVCLPLFLVSVCALTRWGAQCSTGLFVDLSSGKLTQIRV